MYNNFYTLLTLFAISNFFSCVSKPVAEITYPKNSHEQKESHINEFDTISSSNNEIKICEQIACEVWARVNITELQLYLYNDGHLINTFQVTTGNAKHKTPTMNRRPSGPMFVKYTSRKFPGGNYMGLGNMPYVIFIKGGYAIHGTTQGNIKLLGRRVSHGCIRLHPDNAKIFYDLVSEVGLENVWVTIEN